MNTPKQEDSNGYNRIKVQNCLETNQNCNANCLHIKYECCCKEESRDNKNVGEFKLSFSGVDKNDKNKSQAEEVKKLVRVCARVEKNHSSKTVNKVHEAR